MTRVTLSEAISLLQSGQVVAVPTETVYGLAASLEQPEAIEKIFSLKGRPKANPLIVHVAHCSEITQWVVDFPPGFEALAESFWPGPLTFILSVHSNLPEIIRAGLPTAGFRIPEPLLTRQLIEKTAPLVMPSANLSGRPSATRPEHIEEDFGKDFPVLDGDVCSKGVESTILLYQAEKWSIARLGALTAEVLEPVLGYKPPLIHRSKGDNPLCPGQLFRHYAPRAALVLGGEAGLEGAPFVLGFKEREYPAGKRVIFLGSINYPEEVAENLYHALRQIDQEGAASAWVDMNFPRDGLWTTIAERLLRAGEK